MNKGKRQNNVLADAHRVISRKITDAKAELELENGKKVNVRRYSLVGKGDRIQLNGRKISILLKNSEETVQISPFWRSRRKANIGGDQLSVLLKEIETEEELEGYRRMTQYHYRGNKGVGRSVPIVAVVKSEELPKVVGFIEITSTLLANSARRELFDSKFSDPESGIAWICWNGETSKKFSNRVARISRCVVFPELRGIGLSTLLCKAAIDYCKSRWHIAGLRPIFLEITADMLRYYPFVRSSGFEFIGDTAGNANRLTKDMQYLLRKYATGGRKGLPKGGGGIMSLQISYTETLRRMMSTSGKSLQQVVDILKKTRDKLSDEEWIALHNVYRRPKPTYMFGLHSKAHDFILKRKNSLGIAEPEANFGLYKQTTSDCELTVEVERLSVKSSLSGSASSRAVQESFGFVSKVLMTDITSSFQFTMGSREVILISGPSGSGKSILLNCLMKLLARRRASIQDHIKFEATCRGPRQHCVAHRSPKMNMAPVDQFDDSSLEAILKVLSVTGLAEPHTFVRPAKSLSEGQKYRLGIAVALAAQPDILFLDAFCESIDRFTTIAVCKSLRSAALDLGFSIVTATARPEFVTDYLAPTITINLTSTEEVRVFKHDA